VTDQEVLEQVRLLADRWAKGSQISWWHAQQLREVLGEEPVK